MQLAGASVEQTLIRRMNAADTMKHINVLNQAPRVWRTEGYTRGLEYVSGELRRLGWDVKVEEMTVSNWYARGTVRNLVATRRGSAPDADRKQVVAGAHLDTVRGAPGANDNASGSATLLELARSFAGIDTRNDIKLVWFDGEEAGLLGSFAFAKTHRDELKNAVAMINMDMVGSPHGAVGFDLGMKTGAGLQDAIRGVQQRTGLAGTEHPERHDRSDHASFDNVGVPSVDFGVSVSGVDTEDPNYHSPNDTADKINPAVLEGYGDLIACTLYDLAMRDKRP